MYINRFIIVSYDSYGINTICRMRNTSNILFRVTNYINIINIVLGLYILR